MNRKQKIIISVVGITIVLLALLGITYAYYLTRIEGNTNINSISITTADLNLKWIDGTNNLINSDSAIIPGEFSSSMNFSVKNNGNSNIDEYAVALEEFSVVYAANSGEQIAGVRTNLVYPEDFKLVITCESDNSNDCNGLNSTLPTTNEILLTNSINIGETQTYTVTLTYIDSGIDQSADMNKLINGKLNIIDTQNTVNLTGTITNYSEGDYVQTNSIERKSSIDSYGQYKIVGLEPGEHTIRVFSKDGEEKASKEINIVNGEESGIEDSTIIITKTTSKFEINIDTNSNEFEITEVIENINPFEEDTLPYLILNNAFKGYGDRTVYKPTPITSISETTNVLENERTLSTIPENNGVSYYFRGNVKDNYVNAGGMCWRIVRIQEDGNVKLMLASKSECQIKGALTDNSSYDISCPFCTGIYTGAGACGTAGQIELYFSNDFKSQLDHREFLVNSNWCFSDHTTLYDEKGNVFTGDPYGAPNCGDEEKYTYYDGYFENEISSLSCSNPQNLKYGTLTKKDVILAGLGKYSYMLDNAKSGIGLATLEGFDGCDATLYFFDEVLSYYWNDFYDYFVPSIVIKKDTLVLGEGTINNPYIVKTIKAINDSSLPLGGLYDTIYYEEGMTWSEWANSKYSDNFNHRDGNKIHIGSGCEQCGYSRGDEFIDLEYCIYEYIDINDNTVIEIDEYGLASGVSSYDDYAEICE